MHKSDYYVGQYKFLHGFIKDGLAKVKLKLQMDNNFLKFNIRFRLSASAAEVLF